MKRLSSLAIAGLTMWAVSGRAAANPGETQAGDSVLKLDTGDNTKAKQNKIAYLQMIEGQIRQFDRELVQLRMQRDRLTPGTGAHKSVDSRVEAMNSRMAQIRRDLATIQAEDGEQWRVVKENIDENLSDLSRLSRGLAE